MTEVHKGECKAINTISTQKHEDYIWVTDA